MIARTYPGTDIPDLTDSQIKDILRNLDMQFNKAMIRAGGHGKGIQIHAREVQSTNFLKGYTPELSPSHCGPLVYTFHFLLMLIRSDYYV